MTRNFPELIDSSVISLAAHIICCTVVADWLSQYCIFGKGSLEVYRSVFDAVSTSTKSETDSMF